jgi:hypothetical protein
LWDQGIFDAGQPGGGFGGFFGGGGDGLQLRGAQPGRDNDPRSGRRPDTTVNVADRTYYEAVSEAYKAITGITRLATHRRAEGAFFQFGYFQYGVPSFSTPGWGLPATPSRGDSAPGAAGDRPPGGAEGRAGARGGPPGQRPQAAAPGGSGAARVGPDAAVLAAFDSAGIDAFVAWTPFTHPDLGAVEIGGFRPYAIANPPADRLAALGRSHGAFATRLAGMLPRVRIAKAEVTGHGGGVFTVVVEVENAGFFPTALRHGVVSRSVDPTTIQIQVPPEAVLTGDPKSRTADRIEGSGARVKARWVIRGTPGSTVEIRARSQKGGTATTTVTLR